MHGYTECTFTDVAQLAAISFYIRRAKELFDRGGTRTQKIQELIEK
ncbi:MAG: hypothetical protein HFP77_03880 [Methylococcales symbiont of Iophon sp. n. MRB-2018]|nr:MAG: hypothetical protein HFP77_03880 [Methylococcales symbiont of Iophon sp. n. MRB-2018]